MSDDTDIDLSHLVENKSHLPHYLVFDIETIPDISLLRKVQPTLPASASEKELHDTWLAERNAKRAGKQNREDKNDRVPDDMFPVSMLMPLTIGWLTVARDFSLLEFGVYDAPQCRPKEATSAFWADVAQVITVVQPDDRKPWERKADPRPPERRAERCGLVSFNGKQFDLPVLEAQSRRDALPLPFWYVREGGNYEQPRNKYYSNHYDLFKLIGNDGDHWPKLDTVAKDIGLPGKGGIDGSKVWPLYLEGKRQEIADYCLDDVFDTYWLFVRYAVQRGWLPIESERKYRQAFMDRNWSTRPNTPPGVIAYANKMREIASLTAAKAR